MKQLYFFLFLFGFVFIKNSFNNSHFLIGTLHTSAYNYLR